MEHRIVRGFVASPPLELRYRRTRTMGARCGFRVANGMACGAHAHWRRHWVLGERHSDPSYLCTHHKKEMIEYADYNT